ncbi:MAG: DUF2849 domain-containing protein [Hyphomonadaceae bacterium]
MKVLTAHDLKTGEVIYLAANDRWVSLIADAARLDDAAADAALKQAEQSETAVIHPYLVPLDEAGKPIARERVRETIRAEGPTVHPGFGKRAEHAS